MGLGAARSLLQPPSLQVLVTTTKKDFLGSVLWTVLEVPHGA